MVVWQDKDVAELIHDLLIIHTWLICHHFALHALCSHL